ncbi:helix-turn-helix transcriptional regulator [bacterium]|nr:helix-turn-helix transcriptional regulator [bacterium]
MNFAINLKRARLAKGFTQKELAAQIGCISLSISRYERGCRIPSLRTIQQIANVLGISVAELCCQPELINE